MTSGDWVSIIVGAVSVFIGVFAFLMSLYFKSEADRLNRKTDKLLAEINARTKVFIESAWPELISWNQLGRDVLKGIILTEPNVNVPMP